MPKTTTKKSPTDQITIKTTGKVTISPETLVKAGGTQIKGFVDFIRTQGVVGLAVGLVLGGAVSTLVKSLIDNIIMTPIGFLLGSAEGLKGLAVTIGVTAEGGPALWRYGMFLNDLINFLVIALVVYVLVRIMGLDKLDLKK